MVSACAGCNKMFVWLTKTLPRCFVFRPVWTSAITGSIAGMAYLAFSELCLIMRIDDPLDAFAVHFGGGLWGLIIKFDEALWQLCWQSVCAVAIIVWSALVLTPAFLILKAFGKMRVPREVEIRGLDKFKHGEAAYPLTAYGHGWGDGTEFVITPLQDVGGDAVNGKKT
ncbi:unnamed protein product [Meloidogyne enterolobii]|uniref:Uncharacterized protein n=1 Tax=Meloidogyne enterolobii TaxID=390850 RepID=A0ACB0ZDP9_MELEN